MSGSQFVPSTVSMYAPVLTGTSFASPNRTESIAQRVYLLLKSMRTILTPIEYKLANPTDNFDQLTRNDMNDIQKLLTLYQEVLNSNLKDLFAIIDNVVSEARNITYRKNINSHIEKIASTLIGTMFSITKISSSLIFEAAQEKTQESTNVKKSTSFSDINRHETVVCRICDERVPVERFEEHTESCIAAYQSEEKLNEVDQALLNQLHEIEDKYLKVDWPGIRVVMIQETIPILQVYLVLKRAYDIDPRIQDASDDLFLLENSLIYSKMSSRIIQLIQSATSLVKDKMRQSMALTSAASILRETRLSGSDQAVTVSAVSIVDFDFIKRISAGAYARVFLGRKKKTGDLYAIKVLPKHEMEIKNQVKRVLAERDILMQFNNPYIVNFCKNNLYLVVEYLPGGDLYSLLDVFGAFDEDVAKLYTMEILEALRYLRSNGIIHRDIKPDNVLVSSAGTLKLTDFGLSHLGVFDRQAVISDPSLASSSSFVGTPDYTAPEIILSKPHSFSADYWSLGIMLYEFLMGEPPFHGENEEETHTNILRAYVDYSEMEEEGFSPEVIDLLKKLLVTDPHKRLGAKDINEIINHQWFAGVDTKTAEPPFVPELKTPADTEYFKQRYTFKAEDDSDILEDMADLNQIKGNSSADLPKFQALSIDQLKEKNTIVAETIRKSKSVNSSDSNLDLTIESLLSSSSVLLPNDIVSPNNDSITPPNDIDCPSLTDQIQLSRNSSEGQQSAPVLNLTNDEYEYEIVEEEEEEDLDEFHAKRETNSKRLDVPPIGVMKSNSINVFNLPVTLKSFSNQDSNIETNSIEKDINQDLYHKSVPKVQQTHSFRIIPSSLEKNTNHPYKDHQNRILHMLQIQNNSSSNMNPGVGLSLENSQSFRILRQDSNIRRNRSSSFTKHQDDKSDSSNIQQSSDFNRKKKDSSLRRVHIFLPNSNNSDDFCENGNAKNDSNFQDEKIFSKTELLVSDDEEL